MDDCLFCKILAGDIPSTEVYSDEHVYAFEDINPGAPCHVLVIPRKHIAKPHDITEADADIVGRLFLAAQRVAEKKDVEDSGYRLVMNNGAGAGQSVFHIHLHVVGGRALSWPPG